MSETCHCGYVVQKGSSSPTVLASKIISETVFDGFEVLGPTITVAGGDSIAVWVEDSDSDFTFSNNEVVAGNGVNGVRTRWR